MNHIVQFALLVIIVLVFVIIDLNVSMKPINVKYFVMLWTCRMIVPDHNCAVDNIYEDFFSMGIGDVVSTLNFWSFIIHFKCLLGMKLTKRSDNYIDRSVFGSNSVLQESFDFWLFVFVYFGWRSYGVTNWYVEFSGQFLYNIPV